MRLSELEPLPSFALLGPGFGADHPVLLTDLRPVASSPTLVLAEYETPGAQALGFSGSVHDLPRLDLDVPAPALHPVIDLDGYEDDVATVRQAIAAGDVYQVCLTVRARLEPVKGAQIAAALCRRGMPRFFSWVRLPCDIELVSASPELFFAIDGHTIVTEPMKGTASADGAGELDTSEKDRAELAMITDLLRNDLTPICRPGTVRVVNPRRFIRLPYAVQTVSDIAGELRHGIGPLEALAALHPGGSITGAPKHAAMTMISALEKTPRGPYCGALGLCLNRRAVFSLLIRTASRCADGWVYGVGGGIVWDSEPEREREEIRVKLGALA